MEVLLTILFITDFNGSTDSRSGLPLCGVWWKKKKKTAAGKLRVTHAHTHTHMHTRRTNSALSVDWPRLSSRMWEWRLQEAGQPRFVWSHPAVRPLANFTCRSFIGRKARPFNGGGEDWKWHSINRNCQTIKQCKQHRWDTDESGCRMPFSEGAKPSRLKGGSVRPSFHLWQLT